MKIKLIIVIVVGTTLLAISALSFRAKHYTPRQESKIDHVMTFMRPGGQTAAGMAEYFSALRVNPLTGTVSSEEYNAAIDASMKLQNSKRVVNSVWNELGPDNVGGRTRAFLQDKDTPTNMLMASVSGGLFRSTTRGGSWVPVNDYQENLNISCITQNTDGVIIYGTGEGAFVSQTGTATGTPGFLGVGIFRSVNRGRSFTRVNSTSNYGNINSMASEKSGGTRMYMSTAGGVRYSDDGLTWTVGKAGASKEVKVDVNGVVYAESGANIVKSTDRGQSWTTITPPVTSLKRASIAISPEDPQYVYVMVANAADKLDGVYRSTNGGAAWTKIIEEGTHYFDPLVSGFSSAQGNYNNVITVNPKDKNHIIMGGAALAEWKEGTNPRYIASLNDMGGANPAYVHADKHILEWDMSTVPPTFICGNDGGLFFSNDNLKTFKMRNFGFNVVQFYSVAADYEGNVVGGSQDNGTQYVNKNGNTKLSAVEVKGGDGFQSEISVKNNSIIFSETYYGNLTRSRDYGKSQACIWDRRIGQLFGLTGADTSKYCTHSHTATWAPFNTMIRLWEHPSMDSTKSRMFYARHGQLWVANDVTNFQKEPEWYLLATGISSGGNQVWDIEPTRDGNSVFISNNGNIYRIDGLNTATYYKWSPATSIPPGITTTNLGFTGVSGRAVSSICLDPNDNNVALVTLGNYGFSNYVYKATNMLGTPTFTNITNNLPAMPVYDGLISLTNANLIFLATDLGVYASDNGGATWTSQTNPSNKFPKVATLAIRQYTFPNRNRGSIYAGTHGRGFYSCQQYKTSLNPVYGGGKANLNISAYPNPANDVVSISFDNTEPQEVTMKIIDLTGKTVAVKVIGVLQAGAQVVKMETSSLPTGTYIVTVVKGAKPAGTIKLVIRH